MRNEELEISNDGGDASNIKASQNFKYKKHCIMNCAVLHRYSFVIDHSSLIL